MDWIRVAALLSGRSLAVGLELWHLAGMKRTAIVDLNLSRLPLSRACAGRGLAALERAGLVSVERGAGRRPRVTILSVEQEP